MTKPPPAEKDLPQPGWPMVEWIAGDYYARWTFASDDRETQEWEFNHDETDRPLIVAGRVWYVRSSLHEPVG